MTGLNLVIGRAAGLSFGYASGFGHAQVVPLNMLVETIQVLIVYPMFEAFCHMQHPQGQRAAALLSGSKVRPSYRSFALSLCRGKRGHDP
jgi:hypothetical protein